MILDEFGKVPVKYQNKFVALLNPKNRQYTSFGHSEKKAECHFIATMWEPLDEISEDILSRFDYPIIITDLDERPEDKKALFSEKEKNYLEHGLFITDLDLHRDASA